MSYKRFCTMVSCCLVLCATVFALCACSSSTQSTTTATSAAGASSSASGTSNTFVTGSTSSTVTVTLPSAYFGDEDEATAISSLQSAGATDVIHNEDGSYTATYPRDKYEQMVSATRTSVSQSLDKLATDGTYASIQSVTYDDDFANITITVDPDAYANSMDGFSVMAAGLVANVYQQVAGLTVNSHVQVVDASGNVINSMDCPADLASLGTTSATSATSAASATTSATAATSATTGA